MDIATIIGLIVAFAMMAASVVMGGGNFASFWDTASVLMVFGGTIGVVMICFPMSTVLKTPKVMLKPFFYKSPDVPQIIKTICELAETARREGLLALEAKIADVKDPFIRLGLQMSVDGARPEVVEEVLNIEIDSMALRHKEGKGIMDQIGKYAPAMGMVGTLLGLIIMLGNMADPSSIGGGMAVALITTLYGAVLSNGSFLPFAEKLNFISRQEIIARQIAVKGLMALQAGENPRMIAMKLNTYLPPGKRPKEA